MPPLPRALIAHPRLVAAIAALAIASALWGGRIWAVVAILPTALLVHVLGSRRADADRMDLKTTKRELGELHEVALRWRAMAKELSDAATTDLELSLGNERQLFLDWSRSVARFQRHTEPFSLAILEVGDALNHDRPLSLAVLSKVAQSIVDSARAEDSVCRLGPQTLGVLLAGAEEAGADAFVARVRLALGAPIRDGKRDVFLAVSGGVGEWKREFDSLEQVVAVAMTDKESFRVDVRRQQGGFTARAA